MERQAVDQGSTVTTGDRAKWSWRSILDLASTLLVSAAAIVFLVWIGFTLNAPPITEAGQGPPRTRPTVAVPEMPLPLRGAPVLGDVGAAVGLLVFSDFQCPFCARFALESMPSVIKTHVQTGKLFIAFRHLPLAGIHPRAVDAARAAECGRQLGRFWEVHDALFLDQAWVTGGFEPLVGPLGLSAEGFGRCLSSPDTMRRVQFDLAEARRLGVVSTPTLLWGRTDGNGEFVVTRAEAGALSSADLEVAIDEVAKGARR